MMKSSMTSSKSFRSFAESLDSLAEFVDLKNLNSNTSSEDILDSVDFEKLPSMADALIALIMINFSLKAIAISIDEKIKANLQ